jgi:hypothetical protein
MGCPLWAIFGIPTLEQHRDHLFQFLRRGTVIKESGFRRAGSAFSFHGSAFGLGCSTIFVRYECLGKALWAAMHRSLGRLEWIGGRNPKRIVASRWCGA